MAFSLQNITATENVIANLSDKPQLNSSALKDKFDQMGEEIKAQVNERIVSAINGAVATSVTANDEKIPTSNAVKSYVDAQIIEAGAGDMRKSSYDTTNTGNKVDKSIVSEGLTSDAIASLKLLMYPIGAIYTSSVATDPSTLFGGTWQRIGEGKVLVGVNAQDSDFNTAGKTGGEKTVTLDASQMPSHSHTASASVDVPNHSHNYYWTNPAQGYGLANSASYTETIMLEGMSETGNTGNVTASHSHAIYVNSYGGGSAHNNMPPYETVYMWKRVS